MSEQRNMDTKSALPVELLKERAVQYARREEQIEVLGELKEFLCFRLGQEWFLVTMSLVAEIVPPTRISRIPGGKDLLLGMMNVRGSIVLMADMGKLLRIPSIKVQENLKIVLLRSGENITGFPVDEVQEVVLLDTGKAQASIATIKGIEAEFIKGLFQRQGKHYVWLDIERVLLEIGK